MKHKNGLMWLALWMLSGFLWATQAQAEQVQAEPVQTGQSKAEQASTGPAADFSNFQAYAIQPEKWNPSSRRFSQAIKNGARHTKNYAALYLPENVAKIVKTGPYNNSEVWATVLSPAFLIPPILFTLAGSGTDFAVQGDDNIAHAFYSGATAVGLGFGIHVVRMARLFNENEEKQKVREPLAGQTVITKTSPLEQSQATTQQMFQDYAFVQKEYDSLYRSAYPSVWRHQLRKVVRQKYTHGYTLAHLAVANQDVEMLKALALSEGKFNAVDDYGHTPIDLAIFMASPEVLDFLLSQKNIFRKAITWSFVVQSVSKQVSDLERLLSAIHHADGFSTSTQKNARPATATKTRQMMKDIFHQIMTYDLHDFKANYPINAADENGNTALHIALAVGNFDAAEMLLLHTKPNIKLKNKMGLSFYDMLQVYVNRLKVIVGTDTANPPAATSVMSKIKSRAARLRPSSWFQMPEELKQRVLTINKSLNSVAVHNQICDQLLSGNI